MTLPLHLTLSLKLTDMTSIVLIIRLVVFYLGFALTIIWISTTGILFLGFSSYRVRTKYILLWNRYVIWSARWICGLRYEVIGAENLPDTAYVALSKHQSQWETYFLQYYLAPVAVVLKRELLNVPFFGWGLRLTNPIAIDRSSPKQALKQTQEQGKAHLEDNISVLIFPEGTRTKGSTSTKYARSGANIAIAAGVPVVPIALNAGEFWPADTLLKYPGKITVSIGKPIMSADLSSREITEQAKTWIEDQVQVMETRN
jgi:1-acyl-sn-glycerol-3-phosphate acyltransferase